MSSEFITDESCNKEPTDFSFLEFIQLDTADTTTDKIRG